MVTWSRNGFTGWGNVIRRIGDFEVLGYRWCEARRSLSRHNRQKAREEAQRQEFRANHDENKMLAIFLEGRKWMYKEQLKSLED
jgi:hypothetical protein